MPVILGPDGPSLGGFVCPATIVDARICGSSGSCGPATQSLSHACRCGASCSEARGPRSADRSVGSHARREVAARDRWPRRAPTRRQRRRRVRIASAGDRLSAGRVRRRRCSTWSCASACTRCMRCAATRSASPAIVDLTPGIRSLQIHYDRGARVAVAGARLAAARAQRAAAERSTACDVPSRIVHLPLSWDDPATQLAIEQVHAVGARRCALVPEQHRVHPPHQRARVASRTCSASCSTRATW